MLRGMSSALVISVNLGSARPTETNSAGGTGIDKHPVDSLAIRAPGPRQGGLGSGVVGDFVGDRKHHGGDTKAVYLVAQEELRHWGAELGRDLRPGLFGENLTTQDLAVDSLPIGQRLLVGAEVVLRVCGPRIPCRTFTEQMEVPGWVRRFTERGRSGAYCAVEQPGQVRRGDAIRSLDEPEHGVDVSMTFSAFMGDLEAAQHVLDAGCLDPEADEKLHKKVRSRQRPTRLKER